jgi:hypothetical protein
MAPRWQWEWICIARPGKKKSGRATIFYTPERPQFPSARFAPGSVQFEGFRHTGCEGGFPTAVDKMTK